MTTECTQEPFPFHPLNQREVRGQFDGGSITSDAGGLLLREVEMRTNIIGQFASCFTDYRDPELREHAVAELVAQRIYGLALGYEDLNDHEELRRDPLLAVLVEKEDLTGKISGGCAIRAPPSTSHPRSSISRNSNTTPFSISISANLISNVIVLCESHLECHRGFLRLDDYYVKVLTLKRALGGRVSRCSSNSSSKSRVTSCFSSTDFSGAEEFKRESAWCCGKSWN